MSNYNKNRSKIVIDKIKSKEKTTYFTKLWPVPILLVILLIISILRLRI